MTKPIYFSFTLTLILLLSSSSLFAQNNHIRVSILDRFSPQEIVVSINKQTAEIYTDETHTHVSGLTANRQLSIQRRGSQIRLSMGSTGRQIITQITRIENKGTGLITVSIPAKNINVQYRGSIEVRMSNNSTKLLIINEVDLEDYVASVVASESGFPELEVLKSQAVISRTYALRHHAKSDNYFDLFDDSRAQVYKGFQAETAESQRSASTTRALVLSANDQLIDAVYSSSNGGYSASNETVWADGAPLSYLRGRPDPFDMESSPFKLWQSGITQKKLHTIISDDAGFSVSRVTFERYTNDGRVGLVIAHGPQTKSYRPEAFRKLLTLHFGSHFMKSTRFNVNADNDDYTFYGRGFGHGVGLSQWGARRQAQQNRNFQDILAFYYQNTTLLPYTKEMIATTNTGSTSSSTWTNVPAARPLPSNGEPTVTTEPPQTERLSLWARWKKYRQERRARREAERARENTKPQTGW